MPLLSIVVPCYNEQDNVELLYERTRATLALFPQYRYEHLFIDNASTDGAQEMVRALFPEVHLLAHKEEQGYARAASLGMAAIAEILAVALAIATATALFLARRTTRSSGSAHLHSPARRPRPRPAPSAH